MKHLASFDIDNTLIKSSPGHLSALLAAIKDVYGLETRADVINFFSTEPEKHKESWPAALDLISPQRSGVAVR